MSKEQLLKIQQKIDKNEIDFSTLDNKQLQALEDATDKGLLNVVGGVRYQAAKQRDIKGTIQEEAVESGTMKGVKVPVLGEIFNERADFELTGDVIGSFTPYIMMRKKIAEDLAKGVGDQKFMAPEGKENFKLDKFSANSSKFYRAVSRVVGKRFGAVGRLLPRIAARTENTARKATQFSRQMAPKSIGGGGGLTDQGQSLLRTGAQTEMYSLGLGATGAAGGSAVYDIANFSQNIGSDSLLDLNDITEDDYKKLPQPAQMLVDAGAAFANSAIFGVAGTTAGYYAVKGGKSMLRSLAGVNNPEAVRLAKLAKERGMDLSLAQLAQDSGFGSIVKNFFKILGVTPFIGGAGRKKTQVQLESMMKQVLEDGEAFAPITYSELLGAEGVQQLRKNYDDFQRVIALQYSDLEKVLRQTGGNELRVVPTAKTKSALDSIAKKYFGEEGTDFRKFINMTDEKKKAVFANINPMLVDAITLFAGKADNLKFDYTTFADYKKFKTSLNNMSNNPLFNGKQDQSTIALIKETLDEDLASFEKLTPEQLANPEIVNSFKGKSADEVSNLVFNKENGYKKLLENANKTYYDLTSAFEKGLADRLRKGIDTGKYPTFLTPAMVNKGQVGTTPKEQFEAIQRSVLHADDAETVRQFKKMIGVVPGGGTTDPGLKKYADTFMMKLGSRKIFDAFYDSLDKTAREKITSQSFDQARQVLKDNGIKSFKFADEGINGIGQSIPPGAIDELRNFAKQTVDGKPNPNYIANPVVREQLENALKINTKKIDMKQLDLVGGDFDYAKFAQNLGIGTPAKEDALREIIGQKAFSNLSETVEILKAASSMNFTDPSTFLARRAGLVGLSSFGAFAGGTMMLTGGLGLFGSLATAVIGRRAGALLADPQASSKLLGIMTEAERKAAMDPSTLSKFLAGPNQPSILGIVDPTEPLGKYYGPKRSRQVANFINYFDDEEKDQVRVDPDKITLNDVNDFIDRLDKVDTPSVNVFQLPDDVLEKAFPEVLFFKYAPQDQRDKMLDAVKGFEKSDQQINAEDAELEKIPDAQPQNTIPEPPAQVPDAPAQAPDDAQTNLQAGRQNFSFLFPGDTTGQAIAQKDQD